MYSKRCRTAGRVSGKKGVGGVGGEKRGVTQRASARTPGVADFEASRTNVETVSVEER
jgi:hypothetical protein